MSQSIHGHEVMHLMMEHGGSFTKQSLREAIVAHVCDYERTIVL